MKNSKFYILLAPIIISAIFCAYSGNESYKKFTELKDLNEKLYKQSLVFQTIKSVIQEHDTLIGKSQEDIRRLRDNTLKNTQKFINSIRKDDRTEIRNINKLKELLANINQNDQFDELFYEFFQNINGEIDSDFKQDLDRDFPLIIKAYATTLSKIYNQLSLANNTKYYVKNIFINGPLFSINSNVRENIYSVKDSTPNLDMLPKSELKENIYKDFNQFEADYQAKKIREAKAKIAFSEKLNIEDIILIKQYEDDKFILLLNSAINIKNELLELTESEKISFGIKTFFEFLLCGLLILSLIGISAWL